MHDSKYIQHSNVMLCMNDVASQAMHDIKYIQHSNAMLCMNDVASQAMHEVESRPSQGRCTHLSSRSYQIEPGGVAGHVLKYQVSGGVAGLKKYLEASQASTKYPEASQASNKYPEASQASIKVSLRRRRPYLNSSHVSICLKWCICIMQCACQCQDASMKVHVNATKWV